jgi:tetratricopeptide (TPR) repeat protein
MLKGQKKITRKELKKDPFFERIDQSVRFYNENQQKIFISLGVILAVVLVVWGFSKYQSSRANEASGILGIAQQYYFAGDYESARSKFGEIRALFGKSKYAGEALYYTGMIDYNEGNYDQAEKLLKEFTANYSADKELNATALATLGAIAASKAEFGQAALLYEKGAVKSDNSVSKSDFYRHAFSYFLKAGQTEKARQVLTAISGIHFSDDKSKQDLINSLESMLTLAEK